MVPPSARTERTAQAWLRAPAQSPPAHLIAAGAPLEVPRTPRRQAALSRACSEQPTPLCAPQGQRSRKRLSARSRCVDGGASGVRTRFGPPAGAAILPRRPAAASPRRGRTRGPTEAPRRPPRRPFPTHRGAAERLPAAAGQGREGGEGRRARRGAQRHRRARGSPGRRALGLRAAAGPAQGAQLLVRARRQARAIHRR